MLQKLLFVWIISRFKCLKLQKSYDFVLRTFVNSHTETHSSSANLKTRWETLPQRDGCLTSGSYVFVLRLFLLSFLPSYSHITSLLFIVAFIQNTENDILNQVRSFSSCFNTNTLYVVFGSGLLNDHFIFLRQNKLNNLSVTKTVFW